MASADDEEKGYVTIEQKYKSNTNQNQVYIDVECFNQMFSKYMFEIFLLSNMGFDHSTG